MKKIILYIILLIVFPLNAYALTLSPSSATIETDPNIPKIMPYEIYNETSQNLKISVYIWDLWFDNSGKKNYAFPSKNNLKYLKKSIAQYFMPEEKEFIIKPKERKQVNIIANIPETIKGGNTAVAFFQAEPFESKGMTTVSMVSRVGSTIFQETKNTLNVKSRITEIDIKKQKNRPIDFKIKIKNEGNVVVSGKAIIGILGENESFYGTFESEKKIIPEGKEISFEKVFPVSLPKGNYYAVVTFTYRDKSITVNKPFKSE